MSRLVLFLLLFLGCVLGSASAQDKPGGGICTKCKNVGRLWCSEHDKNVEEREYIDEDELQFCSVIADCPVCSGTGWILCPQCKPPARQRGARSARATSGSLLSQRTIFTTPTKTFLPAFISSSSPPRLNTVVFRST